MLLEGEFDCMCMSMKRASKMLKSNEDPVLFALRFQEPVGGRQVTQLVFRVEVVDISVGAGGRC